VVWLQKNGLKRGPGKGTETEEGDSWPHRLSNLRGVQPTRERTEGVVSGHGENTEGLLRTSRKTETRRRGMSNDRPIYWTPEKVNCTGEV